MQHLGIENPIENLTVSEYAIIPLQMSGSYESGATLRRMNWQRVLGPIKNEYPRLSAARHART